MPVARTRSTPLFALAGVLAAGLAAAPALADEDHPALTGAVKAFHDVLSPDWHAAPGTARNASACGNAGRYASLSGEIAAQPAPAGVDGAAWKGAAAGLRDASAALGAYCGGGTPANVEAGLATLHDRFHDVMKVLKPDAQ